MHLKYLCAAIKTNLRQLLLLDNCLIPRLISTLIMLSSNCCVNMFKGFQILNWKSLQGQLLCTIDFSTVLRHVVNLNVSQLSLRLLKMFLWPSFMCGIYWIYRCFALILLDIKRMSKVFFRSNHRNLLNKLCIRFFIFKNTEKVHSLEAYFNWG